VNGGKILQPTIGRAVVDAQGHVVRTITGKVRNRVPVSQTLLNYITKSLDFSRGWAVSGAFAYMQSS
jgi:penicillin-binding protein 2